MLLQSKKEVVVVFKHFLSMVCNQFAIGIKVVRSDNGNEFFNGSMADLLLNHGIIHQSSCPYTPQQNGVVERKHRHILEIGRALKIQSHIPSRFWGNCVLTAVYLINRLPSVLLNGKSPYEMMYQRPPNLDHLRVFGCLCFATTLPRGDKFAARAKRAVFIGYSSTQKGYKLYDLETKTVFISRDVIFRENIFPFQGDQSQDSLPLLSPFLQDASVLSDHIIDVLPTAVAQPMSSPENSELSSADPPPDAATLEQVVVNETESATLSQDILVHPAGEAHEPAASPHEEHIVTPHVSRKTGRTSKPPIWIKDYIVPSKSSLYSITDHVHYAHLSKGYQDYVQCFSALVEPKSFKEASQDDRWVSAMQEEIKALEDNQTWDIVDLPVGAQAIGSKWVYKIKYKSNGEVDRFKARLVAKGYTQREGLDYHETFSPVAKMVTVRTIISLAASYGWDICQMDVSNAFLQGDLHEDVYMDLPLGFHRKGDHKVCKLQKSLYGLKQASRQWNIKFTDALLKEGYCQSAHDHSLFTRKHGGDLVVLLVYVDDLLITGTSSTMIAEAKSTLHQHFKMKDLGKLRYFLGIEVMQSKDGILLNQRKYALQLIADTGLSGAKPISTPVEFNHKFTSLVFDQHTGDNSDPELDDATAYQKLIGKLIYLTITRPDIAFGVQTLSQFMQHPKVSHWDAALRIVRYIKKSPGLGVFFEKRRSYRIDWVL